MTVHCGVVTSWMSDWESVPAGCYNLFTRESTLLLIADPGKGQNSKGRAGEMAQQLRALAALREPRFSS